jgi:hypothetical protein
MKGEEFKKLSGTSQIHKQKDILMSCFFVLTQVNESKNIRLDPTFC